MIKIQKFGSGWLPLDLSEVEIASVEEAVELSRQGGVAVEFAGVVYAGGKPTPHGAFPNWPQERGLWG